MTTIFLEAKERKCYIALLFPELAIELREVIATEKSKNYLSWKVCRFPTNPIWRCFVDI